MYPYYSRPPPRCIAFNLPIFAPFSPRFSSKMPYIKGAPPGPYPGGASPPYACLAILLQARAVAIKYPPYTASSTRAVTAALAVLSTFPAVAIKSLAAFIPTAEWIKARPRGSRKARATCQVADWATSFSSAPSRRRTAYRPVLSAPGSAAGGPAPPRRTPGR